MPDEYAATVSLYRVFRVLTGTVTFSYRCSY